VDRTVQVHQMLVAWDEAQATKDDRLSGTPWAAPYAAIDGRDAKATPESSVLVTLSAAVRVNAGPE